MRYSWGITKEHTERKRIPLKYIIAMAVIAAGLLCFYLVGCAPKPASSNGGSGDTSSEQTSIAAWSSESDCTLCHTKEVDSFSTSSYSASLHINVDCLTCHTDTAGLEGIHEKVSGPSNADATALRKTQIDETVCLSCHGSYEKLAEKTADNTVLTDDKGTTVNPHAFPDIGDHATVNCTSCHKLHSEEGDYERICLSCHHEHVYECNTCH